MARMIADNDRAPDFAADFRAAKIVHLAATAPKDGSPIVARNAEGKRRAIRWRVGVDLDKGEPYWAAYDTDEEFAFVDWIPLPVSIDDLLTIYG